MGGGVLCAFLIFAGDGVVWGGLGWFGVVWGGLGWFGVVWGGLGGLGVWGGLGWFGRGEGANWDAGAKVGVWKNYAPQNHPC